MLHYGVPQGVAVAVVAHLQQLLVVTTRVLGDEELVKGTQEWWREREATYPFAPERVARARPVNTSLLDKSRADTHVSGIDQPQTDTVLWRSEAKEERAERD